MDENTFLVEARKRANLSREHACRRMSDKMSTDHLRRLEAAQIKDVCPEEILLISKAYNDPSVIKTYCSHICGIGKELSVFGEDYSDDISHIALNIIASLNELYQRQEAITRIFRDQKLDQTEKREFERILNELKKLKLQIEALQLWCMTSKSSAASK